MEGKKIIESFLKNWHEVIKEKDYNKLDKLINKEIRFESPVVYKLKSDKVIVLHILQWILDMIKNFTYIQEFYNYEDLSLVLLFEGKICEKDTNRLIDIQGVDLIKLNKEGQVQELKVMIRPLNSILALKDEMGKRLAAKF